MQARPFPQVGLGQGHHQAVARLDRQRRSHDRLRLDAEERHGYELALVAGREGGERQHPGPVVGEEAEAGVLGEDLHPREAGLLRQDVAEGRAVVEGAEDDVEANRLVAGPLERHRHLLTAVAGLARLPRHERVLLVPARALHVEDAKPARERARLPQGEPEAGAGHDRLPPKLTE